MKTPCLATLALALSASLALAQSMPETALDYLDADGDDRVSQQEFASRMDAFFQPMDTDGSGQLTFGEVGTFMPREVFDAADTSGNGALSRAEYQSQVLRDFQGADANGDGALD